jgi:hypothetical protein
MENSPIIIAPTKCTIFDKKRYDEYGTYGFGTIIGMQNNKYIVRFTDSDNTVKIRQFEKDKIKI